MESFDAPSGGPGPERAASRPAGTNRPRRAWGTLLARERTITLLIEHAQ